MSVAAQGELGSRSGVRSARWAPALASLLALVIVAATVEIVLDGAAGHTGVIPAVRLAGKVREKT